MAGNVKMYTEDELAAMSMMDRVKARDAMYAQQAKNEKAAKQKAANAMEKKNQEYKAKQVAKNKLANKSKGLEGDILERAIKEEKRRRGMYGGSAGESVASAIDLAVKNR